MLPSPAVRATLARRFSPTCSCFFATPGGPRALRRPRHVAAATEAHRERVSGQRVGLHGEEVSILRARFQVKSCMFPCRCARETLILSSVSLCVLLYLSIIIATTTNSLVPTSFCAPDSAIFLFTGSCCDRTLHIHALTARKKLQKKTTTVVWMNLPL